MLKNARALEDSPRGLWRTLGKRVGFTPSRVRISHPPLFRWSQEKSKESSAISNPFHQLGNRDPNVPLSYSREYGSTGITFKCVLDGKGNAAMSLEMKGKDFSSLADIDSFADGMKLFPEWLRLQAYVAGAMQNAISAQGGKGNSEGR